MTSVLSAIHTYSHAWTVTSTLVMLACQAAEEENKNKLQETEASLHTAQKDLAELHTVVESERASAADNYAALAQAYLTIDQVCFFPGKQPTIRITQSA